MNERDQRNQLQVLQLKLEEAERGRSEAVRVSRDWRDRAERMEKERDEARAHVAVLANAFRFVKGALQTILVTAPGYDWNADPASLTLISGEAFSTIAAAIKPSPEQAKRVLEEQRAQAYSNVLEWARANEVSKDDVIWWLEQKLAALDGRNDK